MPPAPCFIDLGACHALATTPEIGIWYRAIPTRHLPTALQTSHSHGARTRFNPGPAAVQPFRVLHLAENHLVALFEAGALLGSPTDPPSVVPVSAQSWTILNVQVRLGNIADLTDPAETSKLNVTVQELTGDWRGYHLRGLGGTVSGPVGVAPTQLLGEALQAVQGLEGFFAVSARVPYHKNLVVFPDKLTPTSSVQWQDPTTGQWHMLP